MVRVKGKDLAIGIGKTLCCTCCVRSVCAGGLKLYVYTLTVFTSCMTVEDKSHFATLRPRLVHLHLLRTRFLFCMELGLRVSLFFRSRLNFTLTIHVYTKVGVDHFEKPCVYVCGWTNELGCVSVGRCVHWHEVWVSRMVKPSVRDPDRYDMYEEFMRSLRLWLTEDVVCPCSVSLISLSWNETAWYDPVLFTPKMMHVIFLSSWFSSVSRVTDAPGRVWSGQSSDIG